MKKNIRIYYIILLSICFVMCIVGCSASSKEEDTSADVVANECPYAIRVNDQIWYCYWEVAEAPEEDEICGKIMTYVDSPEMPVENEQSNFESCVGEEWAISHGRVLIHCEDEWYKCVLSTVPDTPTYPE